ncbi:hypothetical protein [Nocardioides sp. CFH 31398]|uniref:hypothetical protein n=1 Tax=Nocardioides sp. CFH 31398 TaxID=2919579 RepID=UPI001F066F4F|nr:hypothetical protein [Nocardioides sp. CFH 31398]MCH1865580.1 hypothetical protein [Nocardioides sp. CFH 31398]
MVTRALAALLTTLVAACSVVVLGAAPAQACRCVQQGVAQQAGAADLVVSGVVTGQRDPQGRQTRRGQQGPSQFGTVTLVVDVDRVYAGALPDPTIEVTTAAATSACGLGRVPRGEEYLFFLTDDARTLRATSCNGTAPASAREVAAVERTLGEGRPVRGTAEQERERDGVDADEPVAADLTVVDDAPAPDAARTALPGGLLAAVGLVGLLVLRRFGAER